MFNSLSKKKEGSKKLDTYRVHTNMDCSNEFESPEEAEKVYENWKDSMMTDSVVANKSYVEIAKSSDGFEDYEVIKKVIAAIDLDRTELRTPREEGFDWDYWAKWQEVDLSQ
ncbi:hypothetical protein A616_17005 [Brevibacillus brevis X23]|nr:hypothetical protein A616_17005 [Brevibacillus brevis X23]